MWSTTYIVVTMSSYEILALNAHVFNFKKVKSHGFAAMTKLRHISPEIKIQSDRVHIHQD
jgi:hypothetical protein